MWFLAIVLCQGACMKESRHTFVIPNGIKTPWKPATEEEVRDAERQLGRTLPEDYRQFLLTVNGIKAVNPELVVKVREPTGHRVRPLVELSTLAKDAHAVSRVLASQDYCRFNERVPKKYLFIGSDGALDSGYCMSLEGENRGYVYYWCPEDRTVDVDLNTEDYLTLMAKSFKEFWASARPMRDDDLK
jgi:hypothetical protein